MDDIELIQKARQGSEQCLEELLNRYKPLANKISRRYFLAGQDDDDLRQEALIGLFKAYQGFSASLAQDFKAFATLCITRQIQTAVKSANRLKNKALNECVSLNNQGGYETKIGDEDEDALVLIIPSTQPLPDDELILKEKIQEIKLAISNKLSNFEKKVLLLYLEGLAQKEMAKMLNKSAKSIEGALSRIKSKLAYLK